MTGGSTGRLPVAATPGQLRSATVFQSDSTFPWLTVEQNLRIGLSGLSLPRDEAEARIARYLALVGLGGVPPGLSRTSCPVGCASASPSPARSRPSRCCC